MTEESELRFPTGSKRISHLHSVQTSGLAHSASYSTSTTGSSSRSRAVEPWSYPFTSSTEVKKECSSTFTPPYAFTVYTRTALPLPALCLWNLINVYGSLYETICGLQQCGHCYRSTWFKVGNVPQCFGEKVSHTEFFKRLSIGIGNDTRSQTDEQTHYLYIRRPSGKKNEAILIVGFWYIFQGL